jgi:UDP-glucose 4-epimerase
MKILITGSNGQLGGALCHYLTECNEEVVGLSRSLGRCKDLLDTSAFRYLPINLEDPNLNLDPVIDNGPYDAAIMLAASVSRESDSDGNQSGFDVNVKGHAQLLEALGHNVKQVVYGSSVTVYGFQTQLPVFESCQTFPRSDYAATRLAGECILEFICRKRNINWVALRIAQVYGPDSPDHLVLYRFLEQAFSGTIPVISVDPQTKRHYLHLEDFLNATLSILGLSGSGVFNLAGPETVSLHELAMQIMKLAKIEGEPIINQNQPGHSLEYATKAFENLTGFLPRISIREGLQMEAKRLYG